MGLIVRTAGLSRTKTEIKRDFDYLARLWDEIREKTLTSSAPALIYRDSDLIKRAIRDLYHREIDEVMVEGEDGYKAARGFMKLLMPSHVRRVKHYVDPTPIFQRYGVEDQLTAMYQPVVQLKSGGYLVINPTEALVSIDINSGRSTREHNIEQTAFATNLEAAAEIARQLRLRDMAGLVVIDFIDMEQSSHVRKVEKAMKEALKNDRARIQVGRISSFGLMEMSRQRLRTGVLEASTKACPHCEGTGLMRTASSAGLSALRIIEDEAARGRGDRILLRAGREAAIYVLNRKRAELAEIEERYGVTVEVVIDEAFEGARMTRRKLGPASAAQGAPGRRTGRRGGRGISSRSRGGGGRGSRGGRGTPRPREAREREDEGEGGTPPPPPPPPRRTRPPPRWRSRAMAEAAELPETAERAARSRAAGRGRAEAERRRRRGEGAKPRRGRRGGRGRRGTRRDCRTEAASEIAPDELADGRAADRRGAGRSPRPSRRRRRSPRPAAVRAPARSRRGSCRGAAEPAPAAQAVEVGAGRQGSGRRRAASEAKTSLSRARPKGQAPRLAPRRSPKTLRSSRSRAPKAATTPSRATRTCPASRAAAGGSGPSANARRLTMKPARASMPRAGFHLPFRLAVGQRGMTVGCPAWSGSSCSASLLFFAAARPALAQSILRDSETELLFQRHVSEPLIEAAGLDPKSVKVVLINDPEINAFVAAGPGRLYPQRAAHRGRQRQPAAGRHRPRAGPRRRRPRHPHLRGRQAGDRRSRILSLVLGAAAIAAGAGDAGMGILAAGQQAAMGSFLAFTRAQEVERRPGRRLLSLQGRESAARAASNSSRSCRTRNIASRSTPRTATTAPTRCRASASPSLTEIYQKDPAWNRPTDPALEARFQRVKAKLIGYVDAAGRASNSIPKATRASRPIMPAPTPIISAPIPTKPMPKPTRCSRPLRTIPSSSN